jgi:acetoin utilization deacetylase AcuC-like enzyme
MPDLLLVHRRDYVERFLTGQMSPKEMRLLGFPWSAPLARRARLATQGTITASLLAWQHGLASNLAGGSHHAFADHGEGFSVFNDIAVAIRVLQRDYGLQRAAIIDCDVHQGNGTATIFAGDASVFTCSLHGEKNYPFRKAQSSLDFEFPDGTDDAAYLAALRTHLPAILERFEPQMVWYLAGVDPYVGDKLGRLALTLEGLRQRDAYVLSTCRSAVIPVVTTMGGGYAPHIEDIVEAHCQTVRLACEMAARPG